MSDNSNENCQSNYKALCCSTCHTSDESGLKNEIINCPLNLCKGNKVSRVWKFLRPLNLIVFMLIFGITLSLRRRYRKNVIYRQLCMERFKSDSTFCYRMDHNVTELDLTLLNILKLSTSHEFAMIGLKIAVELFSACVLCSWSDSYGRKFPLLMALLGESVEISSFFIRNIPYMYFIWTLYILTALSGLFGGFICIFAMTYCILTDHSSLKNRSLSFAMIDFSYMIGIICGVIISRNLIARNVILAVFLWLLPLRCILIIWIWLTVADKHFDLKDDRLSKKIKLLFSRSHIKKIYKSLSRWRLNCQSEQLLQLMFSAIPVMISYSLIEGVITTSLIHASLFPSFEDYEQKTLIFALYSCFAVPIGIAVYMSLAKFKDSTLGIIGFSNLYLSFFISAFATDYLTFLVGLGLAPLKGFAAVGLRSAYSKIAEEHERGKLFYSYASCEVGAIFFSYFLYEKLSFILTPKDDILPHMVLCTLLVLALCTFIFQVMSIHTGHLFEACYRYLPVDEETRSNNTRG